MAEWNTAMDAIQAVEVDERLQLMESFVSLDNELNEARERRADIDERIDSLSAKRSETLRLLSDALGLSEHAAQKGSIR